jgi:hypothetical protein
MTTSLVLTNKPDKSYIYYYYSTEIHNSAFVCFPPKEKLVNFIGTGAPWGLSQLNVQCRNSPDTAIFSAVSWIFLARF